MVHGSVQEADSLANADRFRNDAGLAKPATDWPVARRVEIWNSLPGVTAVTKFKDRATGASRIWKAIQTLEAFGFCGYAEDCDGLTRLSDVLRGSLLRYHNCGVTRLQACAAATATGQMFFRAGLRMPPADPGARAGHHPQ